MQLPAILKADQRSTLITGLIAGAALTILLGFWPGGWVTGGGARTMATAAVDSALLPVCADQMRANPAAMVKYAATRPTDHDDVVREFVKKVGPRTMDYQFARECAKEMGKTPPFQAQKS